MNTAATGQAAEKTDRGSERGSRDNPAHAVLKHLAGRHPDEVKAAFREVTLERLESGGAVAGVAALRAELFGGVASGGSATNGGGAREVPEGASGHSRGEDHAAHRTAAKARMAQQSLPLAKALADEEVDEEEVEDDIDSETPAPDEEELRRPVARAGKGKGGEARKGKAR